MNELSVPSAVQDITLSINIEGKWTLPNNKESSNSVLTIPNFSSQENGEYKFYTNNWDGVEMCAIQIDLTTTTETTITGLYSYIAINNQYIYLYPCNKSNTPLNVYYSLSLDIYSDSIVNPDIQLIYNDTEFDFFNNLYIVDWCDAQRECLNWGGNLATIKSVKEDSLLYYISKDTTSTSKYEISECYIGLNNISNEASESGSDFTWVDGSSSDYFKNGSLSDDKDRDCMLFRSKNVEDVNSSRWSNEKCDFPTHCRICSKSGKQEQYKFALINTVGHRL